MVTLVLEGAAAQWMVTLHNASASELNNFNWFMTALRQWLEDSLGDWKARDHIKTMQQGCRAVTEYTEEFRDLVCCLNRPEDILMSCFKDGLNDDLYTTCITRRASAHDWCVLAKEVEIDQAQNKYHTAKIWKKLPPERKRDIARTQAPQLQSTTCFKCGMQN